VETYALETIRTVPIAEVLPVRRVNTALADYLRKKLQDNSAGFTPRMILEEMTDQEVIEVYHSHHATVVSAMKAGIPVKSRFM
jgi:hypothetical protein